jgi:hypothetical protein
MRALTWATNAPCPPLLQMFRSKAPAADLDGGIGSNSGKAARQLRAAARLGRRLGRSPSRPAPAATRIPAEAIGGEDEGGSSLYVTAAGAAARQLAPSLALAGSHCLFAHASAVGAAAAPGGLLPHTLPGAALSGALPARARAAGCRAGTGMPSWHISAGMPLGPVLRAHVVCQVRWLQHARSLRAHRAGTGDCVVPQWQAASPPHMLHGRQQQLI